jgi:hypothetical protein
MINTPKRGRPQVESGGNGDNNRFPADLRAARGLVYGLAIGVGLWVIALIVALEVML